MNAKTRRAIEQAARHEGALKVEWFHGHYHIMARFHMPDGRIVTMPVSKSTRVDDYKHRGWTRQYIRSPSKGRVRF